MTPEQIAILKGAALDRNPTARTQALREVMNGQHAEAVSVATTALAGGKNCRDMSVREYATFRRNMTRALRGLPRGD